MKYITIHDGYDINYHIGIDDFSNKQWPLIYWELLIKEIKKFYPDYKIIQLGTKTGRKIQGVDECLLKKTTLIECFDIISYSSLHIDGDSGLVHAASRLNVPCVVMFGPTPDYFYGYDKNINLRSDYCKDACYWINGDWMNKCPIGHKTAKCMDQLTPQRVFEAVKLGLISRV